MVNFGTSAAGSIPRAANDVIFEAAARGVERHLRPQRIDKLREVIESGQYRVSAADLADSLLRLARQAN
jgi:anti-sigma28 factor (negative regulator of flagellin synthesis)